MKLITTSAAALTLLVAVAPLAAFADDSNGAAVSGSAQVNVQSGGPGPSNSGEGIRADLRGLLVPTTERPHVEANGDASSTGDMRRMDGEHASTTRPMNGGLGKNGDGSKARTQSDTEITARIASLNKMIARLGDATRLTPDAKTALTATLTTEIANLTSLKGQIDTEGTTTLKTDEQSITKDFRVYALVLPKAAINAAADRVMTIVGQMQTLSGKIGDRITAAQAAGADVSAAVTAHTDFDAKVADASVQAQAAVSEVANLSPDAGATTTLQANTSALKDAKTKIDAAQADLKAARADVDTILKAIRGKGEVKVTASTTSST